MAKASKPVEQDADQAGKERTTIYLRKDLFKKIKHVAYKEDSNNTLVIENALIDFFDKWEKKNGEINL